MTSLLHIGRGLCNANNCNFISFSSVTQGLNVKLHFLFLFLLLSYYIICEKGSENTEIKSRQDLLAAHKTPQPYAVYLSSVCCCYYILIRLIYQSFFSFIFYNTATQFVEFFVVVDSRCFSSCCFLLFLDQMRSGGASHPCCPKLILFVHRPRFSYVYPYIVQLIKKSAKVVDSRDCEKQFPQTWASSEQKENKNNQRKGRESAVCCCCRPISLIRRIRHITHKSHDE